MDHKYWEEQLQAYIDGELDPADHSAVENHMASCEDCQAQNRYFAAMKKRLKAHAETVTIPPTVETRIQELFQPKKAVRFPRRWIYSAGLLAAAILLALMLGPIMNNRLSFSPGTFIGKIVCHDCTVAHQAGLDRGTLCQDGHTLGLMTERGRLYRIANDEIGHSYIKDPSLYGDRVRVDGEVLKSKDLLRIQKLEKLILEKASL